MPFKTINFPLKNEDCLCSFTNPVVVFTFWLVFYLFSINCHLAVSNFICNANPNTKQIYRNLYCIILMVFFVELCVCVCDNAIFIPFKIHLISIKLKFDCVIL